MLEFEVNGQRLRIKGNLYVVAESIDYLKARFSFSADWDSVIKTAIFKTADRKNVYHVILDENGICTVPSEVIHAPMFHVSVFGGSRITANEVEVLCDVSGYAEGGAPEEPTPDVYEQILAEINKKVSKVEGMGLSQNSYTNEEKDKLAGVAEGAEVNVQSDWNQTDAGADDYIKNKPTKLSEFENDSGYTTSADFDSLAESVAADVKGIADAQNAHKIAEVLDHPDGSVTEAKIADGAVTTDKLADGVVTAEKIADGVLFSGKYDDLEGVPTEFPPSGHSHTVGDITDLAEWVKQPEKPTYTADEVGALAADGTAVRATADAVGNNIPDTYATKVQVDGLSGDVTEVKGEVGELKSDLDELTVVVSDNVFRPISQNIYGLSIIYDDLNGWLTINGTPTINGWLNLGKVYLKAGTWYIISLVANTKPTIYLRKGSTNIGLLRGTYQTSGAISIEESGEYTLDAYVATSETYSIKTNLSVKQTSDIKYNKYRIEHSDLFRKSFINKTYSAIGDSLTFGFQGFDEGGGQIRLDKDYPTIVKETLDCGVVNNFGETGTTIANDVSKMESYYPMSNDNRLNNYGQAEIISVMGGTNDYQKSCVLGDLSSDETTFYGGYIKLLRRLRTDNANSFIFVILPPITIGYNTPNEVGKTAKDYMVATKEICEYLGVPYLDMCTLGELSEYNHSIHCVDSVHFTQKYVNEIFAPHVVKFIEDNYLRV